MVEYIRLLLQKYHFLVQSFQQYVLILIFHSCIISSYKEFEENLSLTTSTSQGCSVGDGVDSHGGGDDGVGRMWQLKASDRV